MPCTGSILTKALVLAAIGAAAGGVHWAAHKPLQLRPAAPEGPSELPTPVLPPVAPAGAEAAQPRPTPAPAQPATPEKPKPRALGLDIGVEQSWEFFQQGKPFVDARNEADYTEQHVENAYWMPAEAFAGGAIPDATKYMDANDVVVIYCSGGDCDASHNVAVLLQQLGYKRCHVMKDGLPGWAAAGHPTATGKPEGAN